IDHSATRTGEVTAFGERVITLFLWADRPDLGIQRHHYLLPRLGSGARRITAQIVIRQHIMPEWTRVLRAKPMAPVVSVSPKLRRSALRFQLAGVRSKPEIARPDKHLARLGSEFRSDAVFAVMPTGGAINPAIEAPPQPVR